MVCCCDAMYRTQQRLQTILSRKGVVGLADPCANYFQRNKKHFYGGIIVMCIFAVIIPSTIITTSKKFVEILPSGGSGEEFRDYKEFHDMIESENEQDKNNEDSYNSFGKCTISKPMHPHAPMNPILVASFPGSSSDLMRLLIEATTGIWTSARLFRDDVIAIKTHFPYYEHHIGVDEVDPPRGIVVVRNPLETLETFYDFIEQATNENNNKASHTAWISWRDAHFDDQMQHWESFMRFWFDDENLDADKRHIVFHYDLVDEKTGPAEVTEMLKFIQKVSTVPREIVWDEIPCLWQRVVHFQLLQAPNPTRRFLREELEGEGRYSERQYLHHVDSLPKHRNLRQEIEIEEVVDSHPHSYVQLDRVAAILTQMIEDYAHDQRILQALIKYRMNCLEKMHKYIGEDPVLVSNDRGSCMVTTPQYEPMKPMFQASYPGSGSEMMRDVLESITGIKTAETTRRTDVIVVKTYYPYRHFDLQPGIMNRDMKKVILLLRYPLHAIASNFNHIYWNEHNLDHNKQPPIQAWDKWRDEHFEKELKSWAAHLNFWTQNFKPSHRLVVDYESLTDDDKGPRDVTRLSFFIKSTYNEGTVNPAPAFTLPCLWYRAVKMKDEIKTDIFQDNRYHTNGNYQPMFTNQQLEMAATELSNLHVKYSSDRRIGVTIQRYWEHTVLQIKK